MRINYTFLVIVIMSLSFDFSTLNADSSKDIGDTKNLVLSKPDVSSNDRVNGTVDVVVGGEGNVSNLEKNVREGVGFKREEKKASGDSAVKDAGKENKGFDDESKKEMVMMREKCDSLSNSCTDDDKTFVACLRVPGNESPDLSLLIQNKGKGPLNVKISVPDLVQLEKKVIELQEKEDIEVKVSISGIDKGHFIVLTSGHGDCSLDFRDQFISRNKADHVNDSSYFNIFSPTSSTGFVSLALLLILIISVSICIEYGRRYFTRKSPKYQKLDMELPVSHGSKLEPGVNEGWDDSWDDNWDDEEAPNEPSLPVTPSISSKGMAPRKLSKEGWKD